VSSYNVCPLQAKFKRDGLTIDKRVLGVGCWVLAYSSQTVQKFASTQHPTPSTRFTSNTQNLSAIAAQLRRVIDCSLFHRFFILALLLSAVTACKHAQAHGPTREEARIASQELIKQNLMSLGNARFSSEGEMSIDELEPGRFRVRGFVDYQGKSGRAMRTNYTCVLRYVAKGKWDVEDLKWE